MYQAITRMIAVSVEPEYQPGRSEPSKRQYFWSYTIEIANRSDKAVQLKRRHWIITDGFGKKHEVRGAGVVGEEPIIAPGESYSYTSGCPLETPGGFMVGQYTMIGEDGDTFLVDIPAFSLDIPARRRVLN